VNRRRLLALVALIVAALLAMTASPASAYWTSTGSGTGGIAVARLPAPTDISATASGGQVTVSWLAAAAPDLVALGYVVTRTSAADGTVVDVCGSSPDQLVDATTCDDDDVAPGSYTYIVIATYGGWTTASAPSDPVAVGRVETAAALEVSPSTATYGAEDGTAFVVTVDPADDGTPTGSVDVSSGTTDLCTVTLPDTSCSPDPGALTPSDAPYALVATYLGDATYAGSVSTVQYLTVYAAPTITTTSLTPAVAGETGYRQTLTATGGLPSLTWSVSGGTLPNGLSIDPSSGTLAGTLAAGDTTSSFTVSIVDADGAADSASLTLTVTQVLAQQFGTKTTTNGSSVTLTLPLPITSGDALVVSLDQSCATSGGTHVDAHVTTVSGDSLTWSRAVATGCTADGDAELWYALDAPAAAAGTKVTVSLAGSAVVQFADVAEYRGLTARDGSAPATVEATGTVATAGPGAVTPAASGELVLSDTFVTRATPASLTGLVGTFLPLNTLSPYEGLGVFAIDATTATLTPSYTQTVAGAPTSGPWSSVATAFQFAP